MLEVKNLNISINKRPLVKDVSFKCKENQFISLIGASGSGKSLSSLSVARLLPSNASYEGEILLDDKNILAMSEKDLLALRSKEIAYIFQEPLSSLNPIMSTKNQLIESITNNSQKHYSKLKDILNKVGLYDHQRILKSFPHQLSGGQRQRVMIAMALIRQPRLLIADEPTTALDPILKIEILDLLKTIQKENNISILFISHEISLVMRYSDKIYVMKQGEIIDGFSPKKNLKSLHPYTLELLNSSKNRSKKDVPKLENILSFKDVYFQYSSKQGIGPIGFDVKKNDTLGIVGQSGSGKSTLVKCLLKLEKIQRGKIVFNNKNIRDYKNQKEFAQQIQLVFQDPSSSLNPNQSVLQTLKEVLQVHYPEKAKNQYIYNLLNQVELSEEVAQKFPHQLSGGQKQRVSIARAIAIQPKLLVLDEAVSALDTKTQFQILDLLKKLQEKIDLTFLFIGHDMKTIRYFCNRIIVMKDGKIIEWGSTKNIFEKATHPYTKKLIDNI
ncbi:MAG: ABC transporter ATP-binding protein [Bacteroidota bacterium]|nr:ABC transporter ATP-binding protein [Bacteroidota bacterium]